MIELTHIMPRFAPQIDGLGDYGLLLALELAKSHGFTNRCIVGDPSWARLAEGTTPPFPVESVRERTAEELLRLLDHSETVILNYVGYGYHGRGTPLWIHRAVRRWKQGGATRRLIVVFHELWASGPPWRSEFYLSFVQRRLVSELHRLADAAVTSTPLMLRMLDEIQPGKTAFQPVPSNLPTLPLGERVLHRGGPVHVIAFGQEASRLLGIQAHATLLRALEREGLLAGIRVVGKGAQSGATPSEDVRLLRTFLPAAKVSAAKDVSPIQGSALLGQSDLFLSYYPSTLLCKSGALMAALGCGCVPVLPETQDTAPLVEGRELLACDGSEEQLRRLMGRIRSRGLADIAEAGWQWYDRTASMEVVGRTVARQLQGQVARSVVSSDR
jgi:hypothetical protein